MTRALIWLRLLVSALIVFFAGLSFLPSEVANHLVKLQKFLTNKIDGRQR